MLQMHPNLSKLLRNFPSKIYFHLKVHKIKKRFFLIFLKSWLLLSLNTYQLLKHFNFPHLYSESFPLIGHFCPQPFGQFCYQLFGYNHYTKSNAKLFSIMMLMLTLILAKALPNSCYMSKSETRKTIRRNMGFYRNY